MKGLKPAVGSLTFDAEGQEGGPFHSRTLHVPTMSSGLTIGRGYDCKRKTSAKIEADLRFSGIDKAKSALIAKSAGLAGLAAKKFIASNKLESFEITHQQQLKLFELVYQEELLETKRLCTKADVQAKYGKCDWDNLHPAIREVLVDLKFRGDYTPKSRAIIQKHVSNNDLDAFAKALSDKKHWLTVPPDRFNRRVKHLQAFLTEPAT
jgi:Trm5-related predicted tRNA methylase